MAKTWKKACINEKEISEVAALRADKVTNRMYAKVAFVEFDWAIAVGRRDLTINAMFFNLNGNLVGWFWWA